jgi:probable phosphoglycerate mutase
VTDVAPERQERQLYLVRHGETEWARLGRHTSHTDVPLTDLGRRQAQAIGRRLAGHPFAQVLTSPLARAAETARLAGFEHAERSDDLLEWDYGDLEGRTTQEIRAAIDGWAIWTGPWPGGETPAAVGARVDRVIARCGDPSIDGDTLIFSHGHLLRVVAARWLGLPIEAGGLFALGTGTLGILGSDRDRPVIETWNEACHLSG